MGTDKTERATGQGIVHEDRSEAAIGAAMAVLNELRPGLGEELHENALAIELRGRGHAVAEQKQFPVHYKGQDEGS